MGYIYILTSPSGKSYIGQTIHPIEERFKRHQKKSSRCVAIFNAIQKYEWGNFEKDWYECPDEDLNFDEELLVREMGTLAPGGYNLKEGGWNGKLSEETKQKVRESKMGEKNPMYGKPPSEEHKKKISEATKGEKSHMYGKTGEKHTMYGKTGEKHPKSKRVYQYDIGGTFINTFGSAKEAGRHLNKNSGSKISACALGVSKTAHGFRWTYIKYPSSA